MTTNLFGIRYPLNFETFKYEKRKMSNRRSSEHSHVIANLLATVFPGTSLTGKSVELLSNSIRSNRTCTVQITNHLNTPLTDPKWYCFTGCPYYQMQPVIQPRSREACSFSKKRDTNIGVVGVLSYQFGDSPLRFAIMFAVPYNQLEIFNYFGMAFLNNEKVENYELSSGALFDKMYYDEGFYDGVEKIRSEASGGSVFIDNGDYKILGTMSERGKAIIKIDVYSVVPQGIKIEHLNT